MVVGKVIRFDEGRGYGFIAPDDGGEDVFVHANELTDRGVRVSVGTRVRFKVLGGERGLKAYDVELLDHPVVAGTEPEQAGRPAPSDEELAEIFTEDEYLRRITELLLKSAPQLTGDQILELRTHLLQFARDNGWVD